MTFQNLTGASSVWVWSFGRLHQVEAGSRTQGFYVLGSCSLVAVFL